MKKLLPDFNKRNVTQESWYDLRYDWNLIEASLAKQYGLRIRQTKDMPWTEFCTLVSGLMPDTPLGTVVAIRAEKDPKVIKTFTADQKRIYSDWRRQQANKQLENPENVEKNMENLEKLFSAMFSKGVK